MLPESRDIGGLKVTKIVAVVHDNGVFLYLFRAPGVTYMTLTVYRLDTLKNRGLNFVYVTAMILGQRRAESI